MRHTKFQGHRSTGSGEDFFSVFTIYGHGGRLGHGGGAMVLGKLPVPGGGGVVGWCDGAG